MKLLVFSPYYPPHIGGLESHADEFNKHLSQRGMDITVFTSCLPKSSLEREMRHGSVNIIRFPAFEIIPNYPLPKLWSLNFWRLFLGLFKRKFDIVISRTRFFNTSLLALTYAKIKKVKWIHIEHGSDFVKSGGEISTTIAKIYDYIFGKLILKIADKVVANSYASARFCQKIAKNLDYGVIYRGVETDKIISVPSDLELKNKYPNCVIITFLGRLIDGKGVADLISALSQIKEKNYICFIIGNGPERKKLEKQAETLGFSDKIIFFGYKNFNEYVKILKISDIFINPSYTEGWPTTVAEAAICRNAIVATNVGGTPEIITNDKSGFLIKPRDINSLKEKLNKLIADEKLRKQFGSNAYEKVKDKFNWDNSIEQYLKVFSELENTKY